MDADAAPRLTDWILDSYVVKWIAKVARMPLRTCLANAIPYPTGADGDTIAYLAISYEVLKLPLT